MSGFREDAAGRSAPPPRTPGVPPGVARLLGFLSLVLLSLAVYAPVAGQPFVSYDDPMYVTGNPVVLRGLTAEGVAWAFTATHASNWHPLAWISHMADVTLFGAEAGPHKLVNAALHALNAALVFLLLCRATGRPLRAAFAAALFAVHPLNVESVAWVAERKNLLCALFWLLTVWAYGSYARRPAAGRYLAVLALYSAALLSKPMAVTLPFTLLLLDAWPLGRAGIGIPGNGSGRRAAERWLPLVREKIPLFLLSAASSVATYVVQDRGYAVSAIREPETGIRISNALLSWVRYLGKTFWPSSLAVHYPLPPVHPPVPLVLGAGTVLALLTILFLRRIRSRPWLCPGWFWYLGTLVPVIGIVQAGTQGMADRYMYVPILGILVALAWEAAERIPRKRWAILPAAAAGIACLLLLAAVSRNQLRYWNSSPELFRRAVEVSPESAVARNNYGGSLMEAGNPAAAEEHLRAAIRIRGDYPEAHFNLGECLRVQGRFREAFAHYREALRWGGRDPVVRKAAEEALQSMGPGHSTVPGR